MSEDLFKVVVKGIITNKGKVLIGKKDGNSDEKDSGKWVFIGGHLERGEQVEKAIKREIKNQTGLEVQVHQTIDVMSLDSGGKNGECVQILFHCETGSRKSEPGSSLSETKWIEPKNLTDKIHTREAQKIEKREAQTNFIEKLKEVPMF